MDKHEIYCCLKEAFEKGVLIEPFNTKDFRDICKDKFAKNTYRVFLNKHKVGNGSTTELFIKNEDDKTYSFVKPFNYACNKIDTNEEIR